MTDPSAEDLREELAEIASALRAYVQWQQVSGATGLPRDPGAKQRILQESEQRAADLATAGPQVGAQEPEPPPTPPRELESVPGRTETPSSGTGAGAGDWEAPKQSGASAPKPDEQPSVGRGRAAGQLVVDPHSELPTTLPLLEQQVRSCTACELSRERTNTVFARGSTKSGLCFVGEGPGADEDAQGAPFVGKAGQLLDKMIAAMGFNREEVYVLNIVKCRPPKNRKPAPEEMAACSRFLHRQLELASPEIIVALGATAVEGLLGSSGGITRIRGRFRLYRGQIAVMPTFHPAYLLRNPAAKREVWSDLRQVVQHMGLTLPNQSE